MWDRYSEAPPKSSPRHPAIAERLLSRALSQAQTCAQAEIPHALPKYPARGTDKHRNRTYWRYWQSSSHDHPQRRGDRTVDTPPLKASSGSRKVRHRPQRCQLDPVIGLLTSRFAAVAGAFPPSKNNPF